MKTAATQSAEFSSADNILLALATLAFIVASALCVIHSPRIAIALAAISGCLVIAAWAGYRFAMAWHQTAHQS
ncbi:MAG: hypothetical protein PF501_07600 [Salinisphaera sp.]|jgi:xanthine/uracil permease|nr:hypothetical protein [Salinisphaera sp.]